MFRIRNAEIRRFLPLRSTSTQPQSATFSRAALRNRSFRR